MIKITFYHSNGSPPFTFEMPCVPRVDDVIKTDEEDFIVTGIEYHIKKDICDEIHVNVEG